MTNSVYTGNANFIGEYFQDSGHDFVIPEYQREYSWGQENVEQLFHDLRYGVRRLKITDDNSIKKEQKSKFLGCIIQWKRDSLPNKDFHPASTDYINRIREVIDGQQRTSTMLLIFIRYYFYFETCLSKLNKSPEEKIIAKLLKIHFLVHFSD